MCAGLSSAALRASPSLHCLDVHSLSTLNTPCTAHVAPALGFFHLEGDFRKFEMKFSNETELFSHLQEEINRLLHQPPFSRKFETAPTGTVRVD